jgi:hypothetical protein
MRVEQTHIVGVGLSGGYECTTGDGESRRHGGPGRVQNPQEHGPKAEIRQGIALANAAQAAGVRHLRSANATRT